MKLITYLKILTSVFIIFAFMREVHAKQCCGDNLTNNQCGWYYYQGRLVFCDYLEGGYWYWDADKTCSLVGKWSVNSSALPNCLGVKGQTRKCFQYPCDDPGFLLRRR